MIDVLSWSRQNGLFRGTKNETEWILVTEGETACFYLVSILAPHAIFLLVWATCQQSERGMSCLSGIMRQQCHESQSTNSHGGYAKIHSMNPKPMMDGVTWHCDASCGYKDLQRGEWSKKSKRRKQEPKQGEGKPFLHITKEREEQPPPD